MYARSTSTGQMHQDDGHAASHGASGAPSTPSSAANLGAAAMNLVLSARSFLHGRPRLARALALVLRPLLARLPSLQTDPALAALQRFAQAPGPVSFVQLGSHDGLTNDPLYHFVVSKPDWSGVVVEPVPEHFDALQVTYKDIANRVGFERTVVGASSGQLPFFRLRDYPGMPAALRQVGSLSREHVQQYADTVPGSTLLIEETVDSTTLPMLIKRHAIARVDLLHMDIEGAEPQVLTQIDFDATWAPRALLFEHNHLTAADFGHWKARLRSAGYAVVHGRQDTWAERPRAASRTE